MPRRFSPATASDLSRLGLFGGEGGGSGAAHDDNDNDDADADQNHMGGVDPIDS